MLAETSRLLFRDHLPADLPRYIEIESDPLYRAPQKVHPPAELERAFREAELKPKPIGHGLHATVFKPENRYIGRAGLYPFWSDDHELVPGEANIAYYLARPYWNRGLATEAARMFIDIGFNQLGLTRIIAGINARNIASQRVVEKLGFTIARSGEGGGNQWHEFELRPPISSR
jgi:ribosomal-protein-alanine N-acetyltransferase